MINEIFLENCGPLPELRWQPSPHINLVIGTNGSGKSILLKILYVVLRSTEEFQRGNRTDSFRQIVGEKLRGTFQLEQVGELVRKGADKLRVECTLENQKIHFSFSPSAVRGVGDISELVTNRAPLSFFLPPKEILSLTSIIKRTRLQDHLLGFDDTYLDLAVALEGKPYKGQVHAKLAEARQQLSALLHGRLEESGESWQFKEGNARHSIHLTAEGVRRLAPIDRLIGNRSLYPGSVLFIVEPEATLLPQAIVAFMEILHLLARQGIQIFLASHSYFVLKALYVISKREQVNIQVLSLVDGDTITADLSAEMPNNPIIDESISLYEKELDVEL